MNDELKKIKNELIYLAISLVVLITIFKIAFINESIIVILKVISALYIIFILPGFALLYYWHDKLSFIERFVLSMAVGGAITGLLTYYFGLAGLHIKYMTIPSSILVIIAAVVINRKKRKN